MDLRGVDEVDAADGVELRHSTGSQPERVESVARQAVRLRMIMLLGIKAGEGNRTPDRLITNQLLYQLSYAGVCGHTVWRNV